MSDGENSFETDLWGNRVHVEKRARGRPPFERTEENAHKVSMLLACGWNNSRIAACIVDPRTGKSISLPTLKRHFRAELQQRDAARDMLVARRIMVTAQQAFDGNVGAQRLLGQLIEKNDTAIAAARFAENPSEPDEEKLGKKASAQLRARKLVDGEGTSDWGDDLKPGTGLH